MFFIFTWRRSKDRNVVKLVLIYILLLYYYLTWNFVSCYFYFILFFLYFFYSQNWRNWSADGIVSIICWMPFIKWKTFTYFETRNESFLITTPHKHSRTNWSLLHTTLKSIGITLWYCIYLALNLFYLLWKCLVLFY